MVAAWIEMVMMDGVDGLGGLLDVEWITVRDERKGLIKDNSDFNQLTDKFHSFKVSNCMSVDRC